ncbi:TlpA family protein disulfide reductase [Mucilaginibacter ginkgonis]|uniref:Redoxin domain-containing protein n=1 Tax=Mucilaginibacter ginkgonis TaxID=2682091 RepID=A0A6I4HVI5_9SPHI|nr:redoxin domain-containing protein [Mucilaginibacter ginkgonis]QQL49891.1 redoxin domain-containing protein [Mucilaginibacter ginkgonis]
MKILIIIFLCLTVAMARSQNKQPLKIGDNFPDYQFKELVYSTKTNRISNYKGQWLIMDFWNKYCSLCINRMPALDSIKRSITSVNFLLVGYTGSQYGHKKGDAAMHKLYPELRERFHLDIPMAYDSLLFHKLAIGPCPYVVILDPRGIVRAITTEIKSDDLKMLMAGGHPSLDKAVNRFGY